MNSYGRRTVRFNGAVSLISWTWFSWDTLYDVYVGSLDVIEFWLSFFCRSFPPPGWLRVTLLTTSVCCFAGAARTKPQSPGNKPTSVKITTSSYNPTINSKWTSFNKGVKRLRLLYERREINYSIKSSALICTDLMDKITFVRANAFQYSFALLLF